MNRIAFIHRSWILRTERGLLRVGMIALGLVFIVVGLGMGVSLVMLPPGIIIALSGVGLLIWGAVGDLPLD
jgi:hypothetical protein